MSICNDKHGKPSTSRQIFVHVRESETPMRDVRDLMLDILRQYQEADKMGVSLGVMDKSSSFTDAISWCAILGKLDHARDSLDKVSKEHLVKSVDYLDELATSFNEKVVMQIQQCRDKWMKRVLLWDLSVVVLLVLAIVGGIFWSGAGFNSDTFLQSIQQRPFFFGLIAVSGIGLVMGLHYVIRRVVLSNMLEKMEDKLPAGMSLQKALTRNARIQHSIFRPDPVGWNLRQRKRLQAITDILAELREQLSTVLANYPDSKAA